MFIDGISDPFWPNYYDFDPWILYQRGLYFSHSLVTYGSQSTPDSFYLGKSHTFDIICNFTLNKQPFLHFLLIILNYFRISIGCLILHFPLLNITGKGIISVPTLIIL